MFYWTYDINYSMNLHTFVRSQFFVERVLGRLYKICWHMFLLFLTILLSPPQWNKHISHSVDMLNKTKKVFYSTFTGVDMSENRRRGTFDSSYKFHYYSKNMLMRVWVLENGVNTLVVMSPPEETFGEMVGRGFIQSIKTQIPIWSTYLG